MSGSGRVGPVARVLGFAGLLPQGVAILVLLAAMYQPSDFGRAADVASVAALFYPLFILSFLGGMWWTSGMQVGARQPYIVALAVLPSLAASGLLVLLVLTQSVRWTLIATGSLVVLTLLVDRWLTDSSLAPDGWMRLRTPLSVGLGGMTILAGVLITVGVPGVKSL